MARTTDEVRIGDCIVKLDGTDIGHTNGGVTFIFEKEFAELEVDQYSSPVDYALSGENVQIKTTLAQISNDTIALGIPQGAKVSDGVTFGTDTGFLLSTTEGELTLHPRKNADIDETEDVVIYRAVVKESFELAYNKEDQRLLEITWDALPDETKSDKNRLGHFGIVDES